MIIHNHVAGEPWWQYRDVWLEHNGVAYVLSMHYLPGNDAKYQQAYTQIISSFAWR